MLYHAACMLRSLVTAGATGQGLAGEYFQDLGQFCNWLFKWRIRRSAWFTFFLSKKNLVYSGGHNAPLTLLISPSGNVGENCCLQHGHECVKSLYKAIGITSFDSGDILAAF